jgi:VanZ family protein
MRTRLGLFLWLLGLLFPMAWLGRLSVTYRSVFDAVFGPEWVHVVMHAALYFVLAILLARVLRMPLDWRGVWLIMAIVLGVGILQEFFQLFGQGVDPLQRAAQFGACFDLGVDLAGSLLGLSVLVLFKKNRSTRFMELQR